MGLLARVRTIGSVVLASTILAGCYHPSLDNCTVACSSPDDCGGGQVCGADGMCASPDVAGQCGGIGDTDGGTTPDAGGVLDAVIHVKIMGKGTVTVGDQLCDDKGPANGDCMLHVTRGIPVFITAHDDNEQFQRWTSTACGGQGAVCTLTPILPMIDVTAMFTKMP